jgi:hypothetical protein
MPEADYSHVSLGGRLAAAGTLAFEARLLGPVQVVRSGREVGLGGPRPRAVLALLVLEAGRVVPAGRLVAAARQLIGQVEAAMPPTSVPMVLAEVLNNRAEVERLAGEPGQAAASLRAALDIYERQRATTRAGQTRAALASLAAQPR